jgi:putative endonuclease
MFFVYVIESESRKFRYVGLTKDVQRRFTEHQNGKSKSTKGRGPFKLILTETYSTRPEARKREKFLKSGVGRKWLNDNYDQVVKSA